MSLESVQIVSITIVNPGVALTKEVDGTDVPLFIHRLYWRALYIHHEAKRIMICVSTS